MKQVTIYTTTVCPYCVMLKNFLLDQQIPFKEVNIEEQPGMMEKLIKITGQMGVPQTEVNGKWIVGFDPNQIMMALNN
ncbi:glutaredoxin family protein [Bacillus sp. FJAT-47783]|uniref:glutaredoxin family protein n=1 Tax=Bacillus sp. FJAT-47783 TaxID=2922712 RepID=UPI001FADE24F|nr:glutaredoxin family protein [Bacillus sp. FJAT-47783]